jgi:putative oxidoreductase
MMVGRTVDMTYPRNFAERRGEVLLEVSSGWVEFAAGLLMTIGLLTRPTAAAATILLIVTVFVLWGHGFDWTHGGFEYSALWAAVCPLVCARGGVTLSVDHAIGVEI